MQIFSERMAVSIMDSTFYGYYNRLKLQSIPTKITFAQKSRQCENYILLYSQSSYLQAADNPTPLSKSKKLQRKLNTNSIKK